MVSSHFAESHFAESHFAESHFAESHFADSNFAESHIAESHFAESHFAESRLYIVAHVADGFIESLSSRPTYDAERTFIWWRWMTMVDAYLASDLALNIFIYLFMDWSSLIYLSLSSLLWRPPSFIWRGGAKKIAEQFSQLSQEYWANTCPSYPNNILLLK